MPKLKSNKSARRRFRLTKSGKIKRTRAGKSHLMASFRAKRVRRLRQPTYVKDCDARALLRMLLVK